MEVILYFVFAAVFLGTFVEISHRGRHERNFGVNSAALLERNRLQGMLSEMVCFWVAGGAVIYGFVESGTLVNLAWIVLSGLTVFIGGVMLVSYANKP